MRTFVCIYIPHIPSLKEKKTHTQVSWKVVSQTLLLINRLSGITYRRVFIVYSFHNKMRATYKAIFHRTVILP